MYFNPHHPQGGDEVERLEQNKLIISIHTTRKVVTLAIEFCILINLISIHTTRKVVTPMGLEIPVLQLISIHTTRKVVTCFKRG